VDLETVRTFVAVADAGQFSEAADGLSITQQADERAAASVRPGRRALRVDVVGRRLGPASLLRGCGSGCRASSREPSGVITTRRSPPRSA
jgi:hypothetical protein